MYKLVITGGHFTPGLALIESLDREVWSVFWIGDEQAVTGKNVKTLESQILPGIKIPFFKISTAKFHRNSFTTSLLYSWKFGIGFFQSLNLLLKIKPDVVLSFGSYVSVPVAYAARTLGIPVIIHEQTSMSGLANRIVAKFAKSITLSYYESSQYFPRNKTVLTGNLVRKTIFAVAKKRENRRSNEKLILYITGGSRGSRMINQAVGDILEVLLEKFEIYHQSGQLDFEMLDTMVKTLPYAKRANYHLKPNFTPHEVEEIYAKADLVISRAGANTVSELAILCIPSLLVPLANTEQNEQVKNAQLLEKAGLAEIIPQQELSGAKLLHTLSQMVPKLASYSEKFDSKDLVFENAAEKLINILTKTVTNV